MSTLESDYYAFMEFDPAAARAGLAHYVPFLTDSPVVELACGRGEFLDLLRAEGVSACGVDVDEGMVATARERGHDVTKADAFGFLDTAEPASYGGVFAAHFVEHLQPDDVLRLVRGAARILRPGGRLVLVTPNAASHSIMGYDFWRDPTHVRFYDPALLRFFCEQAGLTVEEAAGNPRNDPGPPPGVELTVDTVVHPSLAAEIAEAVRVASLGRKVKDPASDMGHVLGHLLGVVAERLKVTEESLADLRRAYLALSRALYPPSEVYVVARA